MHASATTLDHDEETYVRGHHVVWSTSTWTGLNLTQKVFAVAGYAKEAVWCTFQQDTPAKSTMCIAEPSCLTINEPSGSIYSVPVPFNVSKLFPLRHGILVTRAVKATARSTQVLKCTCTHPFFFLIIVIFFFFFC